MLQRRVIVIVTICYFGATHPLCFGSVGTRHRGQRLGTIAKRVSRAAVTCGIVGAMFAAPDNMWCGCLRSALSKRTVPGNPSTGLQGSPDAMAKAYRFFRPTNTASFEKSFLSCRTSRPCRHYDPTNSAARSVDGSVRHAGEADAAHHVPGGPGDRHIGR